MQTTSRTRVPGHRRHRVPKRERLLAGGLNLHFHHAALEAGTEAFHALSEKYHDDVAALFWQEQAQANLAGDSMQALQLMQQADVVLYDSLVTAEVLDRVRRDAEKIHVGRRRGQSGLSQADINALMLAGAREGKRVLQLKGGDPSIYGRGGE